MRNTLGLYFLVTANRTLTTWLQDIANARGQGYSFGYHTALGLYHRLSPAQCGQSCNLAEMLTQLFAMMQRAQGPQRQYVSVYHGQDAVREKKAGNRRMWSDPVKVKHWEERLDTDTHIFFPGVQIFGLIGLRSDSVHGSARDLGRTGHP